MILDAIADMIIAQAGVPAGEVFIQHMPAAATTGVLLLIELPGLDVDAELPGKHKGRFQVVVRGTDYKATEERAQVVSDALATQRRIAAGDWLFDWIVPQNLPFPFPRTEGNVQEFSVNFIVSANKVTQ